MTSTKIAKNQFTSKNKLKKELKQLEKKDLLSEKKAILL
jgi:DNA-binding IscR family transcriptional regulator